MRTASEGRPRPEPAYWQVQVSWATVQAIPHDWSHPSLPPPERERKVAATARRELGTAAPSYQQRAGELARRLQG